MTNLTAQNVLNQSGEVGLVPGSFSSRDGKRVFTWDETGRTVRRFVWNLGDFLRRFKTELEGQNVPMIRCTYEKNETWDDVYIEVADRTKISPKSFYESLRVAAGISAYVDGSVQADREYSHEGKVFYVPNLLETYRSKKSGLMHREYHPRKKSQGYIRFLVPKATVDDATGRSFSGIQFIVCDGSGTCDHPSIDLLPVLTSFSVVDEKQPAVAPAPHAKKIPLRHRINAACQQQNVDQLMQHLQDPGLEPDHWVDILRWAVGHGKLDSKMLDAVGIAHARIGTQKFTNHHRSAAAQHFDNQLGITLGENNPVFLRTLFRWMCNNGMWRDDEQKQRSALRVFERLLFLGANEDVNVLVCTMMENFSVGFWENLLQHCQLHDLPLQALKTLLVDSKLGPKLLSSSKKIFDKMLSKPESMDGAYRLLFELAGVHQQNEACRQTLDAWLSKSLMGKPNKIQLFADNISKHPTLVKTHKLPETLSAAPLADRLGSTAPLQTFDEAKAIFEDLGRLNLDDPNDREVFSLLGKFCSGRLLDFVQRKKKDHQELLNLLKLAAPEWGRLCSLTKKNPTLQVHQCMNDFLEWEIQIFFSTGNMEEALTTLFVNFYSGWISLPDHLRLWNDSLRHILAAPNCDELLLAFYKNAGKGKIKESIWSESINWMSFGLRGLMLIQTQRKQFQENSHLARLKDVIFQVKALLAWVNAHPESHIHPHDLLEEAFLCLRHVISQKLDRNEKFQHAIGFVA